VAVAEALPPAGLDPVQADAGLLGRERLAGEARLLVLLEATPRLLSSSMTGSKSGVVQLAAVAATPPACSDA
jgi:hypothetical protein